MKMSPIFYSYEVKPHPTGGWIIVEVDDCDVPHCNQLPVWLATNEEAVAEAEKLAEAHLANVDKMTTELASRI
jgi:hypothetical protein